MSDGRAKNFAAAEKILFWREGEIPWPVIWKKPVEMHAARTSSITCLAARLSGSRRKGEISIKGRKELDFNVMMVLRGVMFEDSPETLSEN